MIGAYLGWDVPPGKGRSAGLGSKPSSGGWHPLMSGHGCDKTSCGLRMALHVDSMTSGVLKTIGSTLICHPTFAATTSALTSTNASGGGWLENWINW